ncbi:unnamed protein product [Parnassius apollo]|uniref:(apollo) hypothetical protein n=1 Tax=Parnassius apollo TaxID=110799 RepID=A0A8S3XJK5_PARAO|nr:unnamed protein product [Parnassius apollo]
MENLAHINQCRNCYAFDHTKHSCYGTKKDPTKITVTATGATITKQQAIRKRVLLDRQVKAKERSEAARVRKETTFVQALRSNKEFPQLGASSTSITTDEELGPAPPSPPRQSTDYVHRPAEHGHPAGHPPAHGLCDSANLELRNQHQEALGRSAVELLPVEINTDEECERYIERLEDIITETLDELAPLHTTNRRELLPDNINALLDARRAMRKLKHRARLGPLIVYEAARTLYNKAKHDAAKALAEYKEKDWISKLDEPNENRA